MLVAANFMVFYPGVASGFLGMVFGSGTTTPFYTPAWIPTIMLVALMAVNARQMADALKTWIDEVKNYSVQTNKNFL